MLLFGGGALVLTLWIGPWGALGLGLLAWAALLLTRRLSSASLQGAGPLTNAPGPVWGLSDPRAALLGAALCALGLALAGLLLQPRREA